MLKRGVRVSSDWASTYPASVQEYQRQRIADANDSTLEKLSRYKAEHGDLLVPFTYREPGTGYLLGQRVNVLRQRRQALPEHFVQRLDDLGFVWNVPAARWEEHFKALEEFVAEHGHGDVPVSYVNPRGVAVGRWLCNIRKRLDRQSEERLTRLTEAGARLDYDMWSEDFERRFDLDCPHCNAAGWVRRG